MISKKGKTKNTNSSGTNMTNLFSMLSLRRALPISTTTDQNHFNTKSRTWFNISTLSIQILTILALGLLLFTSCQKDDYISAVNLNNGTLKAGGVIYYIDPNGDDIAGNGSISSPWRSLYKACNSVTAPGSTIHVNAGIYTETHQCMISEGVSIEGEGVTSHITLTYVGSDYTGSALSLVTYPSGANTPQSISNIKFSGNMVGSSCITVYGRSNVKIHDLTIIDFASQGIYLRGGATIGINYATGNEIYNCIITNSSSRQRNNGNGLINMTGQDGILIHDNILTQTSRPQGENGNIMTSVLGYIKGAKYYNNKSYKPINEGVIQPYTDPVKSGWNFHWESWKTLGGIEVYNNEFHNGVALDIAGPTENIQGSYDYSWFVHDNLFIQDAIIVSPVSGSHLGTGIDFEGSNEYSIVQNNIFRNLGGGINFSALQTGRIQKDIVVRNNLFDGIGLSNEGWNFVIALSASTTTTMQNLSFYNNTIKALSVKAIFHLDAQGTATIKNINIKNNIMMNVPSTGYGYVAFGDGTGTIDNIYLQSNDVYNNVNNNAIYYRNGKTVSNLVESGNITSNPLFVSSSDFHLQSGSASIDAGIDVGLPYNGTKPDIGAFESTGGEATTPTTPNTPTTPVTNQSPVIQNQAFQLDANSANNTLVGKVVASDPDAGQTLTYSILSGNTSGAFIINSLTGTLTVANTSALNFTTNPTFSLVVKVLDNGTSSLSKQATIAVNLNNVNISTPMPKVNQRMLKIFYTEENPNVWKGASTEKGDLFINEQ